MSSTCPHCKKEDAFLHGLEAQYPWLKVQRHLINDDKNALVLFSKFLNEQGDTTDFSVPSTFFCNSRWVGFSEAETSGKELLRVLTYCKQKIEAKGSLTDNTVEVLRSWANGNRFNNGLVEAPQSGYFVVSLALIDAITPCTLFCLLAFFAVLFAQEKTKEQVFAGLLFLVILGVMHYFQQAYTNAFFELVPWIRLPAIATGILSCFLAYRMYKKQNTFNLLLLVSSLFAFIIPFYQQTCVMNLTYMFDQWLKDQKIVGTQLLAYELLYQFCYICILLLVTIAYAYFIKMKRLKSYEPGLNKMGQLMLLLLGIALIVYPWVFASQTLSIILIMVLFISIFILGIWNKKGAKSHGG